MSDHLIAQRIGRILAVGAATDVSAARGTLTGIRVPPSALCVTILSGSGVEPERLAAYCRNTAADGTVLVLISPGEPRPELADRLSTLLGREVWAADGPVTMTPGGSLYVTEPGTGWQARLPGQQVRSHGRRFPVPRWQQPSVPAEAPPVVEIPAGWWLPGGSAADDLPYAVPQNDRLFTVLLGAAAVRDGRVKRLIADLPDAVRGRLLLAPYDADAAGVVALAHEIADAYRHPVWAATGTPLIHPDNRVHATVVTATGEWCRLAERLEIRPEQPPTVVAWTPPDPDRLAATSATYPLAEDWVAELTAEGIWIKPADPPVETSRTMRLLPPDQDHLLVRVGAAALDPAPAPVWAAVRELLDGLPESIAPRVRLLLPAGTTPEQAELAAEALPLSLHVTPGVPAVPGWSAVADLFGRAESTLAMAKPRFSANGGSLLVARPMAPTVLRLSGAGESTQRFGERTAEGTPALRQSPIPPVPVPVTTPVPQPDTGASPSSGSQTAGDRETRPPANRPGLEPGHSMVLRIPRLPPSAESVESAVQPVVPESVVLPVVAESAVQSVVPASVVPESSVQPVVAEAVQPVVAESVVQSVVPESSVQPVVAEPAIVVGAGPAESPARPVSVPDRFRSAEHRSTPAERQRLRDALAWRFDSHVRAVSRALARFPGLRPSAEQDEALLTDLVAVRAVLGGDRAVVDEALRGTRAPVDPALLSCLMAGLLRLPTCRAPVYRYQTADGADYLAGQVLVEPGLVSTRAFPRRTGEGAQELVVWSTNGRRVEGLVDTGDTDEVVFAAGTRFVVLMAEPGRVYLSETVSDEPGDRERRILQRLQQYVNRRPEPAEPATPSGTRLGFDAAGRPFAR